MQIQIAELTPRVVPISELSSLDFFFFLEGAGNNCIYLHFHVLSTSLQLSGLSILNVAPRGLHTRISQNSLRRMGDAFLLSLQLLEQLCAGEVLSAHQYLKMFCITCMCRILCVSLSCCLLFEAV